MFTSFLIPQNGTYLKKNMPRISQGNPRKAHSLVCREKCQQK